METNLDPPGHRKPVSASDHIDNAMAFIAQAMVELHSAKAAAGNVAPTADPPGHRKP